MIKVPALGEIINNGDISYLFRTCADSKFVRENVHYANVVDRIDFKVSMDSSIVNAYASPSADGGYQIRILGGLVSWASNFAFIKTLSDSGMPKGKAMKLARWLRVELMKENEPTVTDMVNGVKMDFAKYRISSSAFCEKWRSILMTEIEACIAHEMGHICLGHCDNPGYDGTVMSSNRNIERQADLFACSILQCGSGVPAKGMGALLLEVSLYSFNPDSVSEGTHPASSERIEYQITSFGDILPKYGVSFIRDLVKAIATAKLPKKDSKPKKS